MKENAYDVKIFGALEMICFGTSMYDHVVGWFVGKPTVPRSRRRFLSLTL